METITVQTEGPTVQTADPYTTRNATLPDLWASVEMHITGGAADFPRFFGKEVEQAGGRYSHMRGHQTMRFVNLPTGQARLMNRIWRACNVKTVILRSATHLLADLEGVANTTGHRTREDRVFLGTELPSKDTPLAVWLLRQSLAGTNWTCAIERRDERERMEAARVVKLLQDARDRTLHAWAPQMFEALNYMMTNPDDCTPAYAWRVVEDVERAQNAAADAERARQRREGAA